LQFAAQNQAELEDVAITAGDSATPRAWNIPIHRRQWQML